MRRNATVVAHLQTGQVKEADATALTKAVLEVGGQRQQRLRASNSQSGCSSQALEMLLASTHTLAPGSNV